MELTAVCLRQRSLLRVLLSHPQSKAHCVSQAHQFAKAGWSVLPGSPALPPQGYANRQAQLFYWGARAQTQVLMLECWYLTNSPAQC